MQKEYCNIIESISKAKQIKDQMIEIMTTRKTDIEDILEKASVIIEGMVENKNRLEIKYDEIKKSQANILKLQEDDVKGIFQIFQYINIHFSFNILLYCNIIIIYYNIAIIYCN